MLLAFSQPLLAQNSQPKKQQEKETKEIEEKTKTNPEPEQSAKVENGITGEEAYKLLYENAKSHNDDLLNTIYWTVGVSLTFLIFILGGQLLFNWRIGKKEIDNIQSGIDEKIAEQKSDLLQDINTTTNEKFDGLDTKFGNLELNMRQGVYEEIQRQLEVFDAKDKIQKSENKRLKEQLRKQEAEIRKNEGEIWLLKGVESNAITSFVKTALIKIEIGDDIATILEDIGKVLEKQKELYFLDEKRLQELVEKVGDGHRTKMNNIKSLLTKLPVYDYQSEPARLDTLGFLLGNRKPYPFPSKRYIKNQPKDEGT